MWCRLCQQDVPASPLNETGGLICPRCRAVLRPAAAPVTPLSGREAEPQSPVQGEGACQTAPRAEADWKPVPQSDDPLEWPPADAGSTPPGTLNLWELDQRLRDIGRILDSVSPILASAQAELAGEKPSAGWLRLDQPHAARPDAHLGRRKKQASQRARSGWLGSAVVFLATTAGTAAFACGGFLVGWSLLTPRHDLWALGVPILLAGQVGIVLAVLVQLTRQRRKTVASKHRMEPRRFHRSSRSPARNRRTLPPTARSDAPLPPAAGLPLAEIRARLDHAAARIEQV